MEKRRISVFLVAGNRLLREALAKLLVKNGDFEVCGVSPFDPEVSSSIQAFNTDVLVVDAVSAQLSEYTLISDITVRVPNIKIVLIDMVDDAEIFLKCVRAGVAGYLLKDAYAADVISAVRSVANGLAVCPAQMCMSLFRAVARQCTSLPSARIKIEFGLTRRQQQLVPLIAQGFTNKEIGCQLNISEQTVKNHIHTILKRVGANDRLQVVDLTRDMSIFPKAARAIAIPIPEMRIATETGPTEPRSAD